MTDNSQTTDPAQGSPEPHRETMDYFMGPEDEAGIDFEDFVIALSVWGWMRPGGQPTVREAADTFGVTDQVILNAVKRHYWMYLEGEEDDDPTTLKIGWDGE